MARNQEQKRPKKWWGPLLAIPIFLIVGLALVVLLGWYEVTSFYENPDHIGFAIPAGAFFLAVLEVPVIALVAGIASFFAHRRRKRMIAAGELQPRK